MAAAHLRQPAAPSPSGGTMQPAFLPGCTGKVKHSRQEAATILQRRGTGQVYRCWHCAAWHTSSIPPAATPVRAKAPSLKRTRPHDTQAG